MYQPALIGTGVQLRQDPAPSRVSLTSPTLTLNRSGCRSKPTSGWKGLRKVGVQAFHFILYWWSCPGWSKWDPHLCVVGPEVKWLQLSLQPSLRHPRRVEVRSHRDSKEHHSQTAIRACQSQGLEKVGWRGRLGRGEQP